MSYYIDKEQPLLFLHIPKTGGASILNAFNKSFVTDVNIVTNNRTRFSNFHSTLQDFEDFLCPLTDIYTFTIVRNPWRRAVSWFFFRKEVLRKGIKSLSSNKESKRVENLKSALTEYRFMEMGFDNWLVRYSEQPWDYTWFSLADNQVSWLKSSRFKVNDIIKLESLYADMKNNKHLKHISIPHINKSYSNNVLYKDIYSSFSRDYIKTLYQEDIDTFKYTFD